MTDPYEILGLARGSSEAEIRRRYLELVRQYPPDRDPERFTAVRKAYELLRDPVKRLESEMFDLERSDSLEAVLAELRQRLRAARISTQTLLSLAERA